jgi:hypothetical protein
MTQTHVSGKWNDLLQVRPFTRDLPSTWTLLPRQADYKLLAYSGAIRLQSEFKLMFGKKERKKKRKVKVEEKT